MGQRRVIDDLWEPRGSQIGLAVSGGVALTVPADAQVALIQADIADVRWRDDGTAPANGTGMLMTSGDPPLFYNGDLSALQFAEDVAASGAVVNVMFYSWQD